ncbi:acetolactate synthase small subunit, partial [Escherichia coli]|nr:acetolactate synthase small subunit [Escherichia coli]
TTTSDEMQLEQIQKQLHKLIDVLKVQEVTEFEHIERELMRVKVKASGFARAEVKRTADIFRGQIVDVTASQYTVQLAGTSEKLDAFIQAISE